jgi:hypothetical protein
MGHLHRGKGVESVEGVDGRGELAAKSSSCLSWAVKWRGRSIDAEKKLLREIVDITFGCAILRAIHSRPGFKIGWFFSLAGRSLLLRRQSISSAFSCSKNMPTGV